MSAPSEKQKVKRYTIPDGEYPPMEMRVADKWGGYVTFNAADEFVLATDFDTLTRDLEFAQQTLEARGKRINELLEAQIAAARETADLRREVERTRTQSERFEWCQSNPHKAQAIFWNYVSRKDRAAAIDAALAASRKGEQT